MKIFAKTLSIVALIVSAFVIVVLAVVGAAIEQTADPMPDLYEPLVREALKGLSALNTSSPGEPPTVGSILGSLEQSAQDNGYDLAIGIRTETRFERFVEQAGYKASSGQVSGYFYATESEDLISALDEWGGEPSISVRGRPRSTRTVTNLQMGTTDGGNPNGDDYQALFVRKPDSQEPMDRGRTVVLWYVVLVLAILVLGAAILLSVFSGQKDKGKPSEKAPDSQPEHPTFPATDDTTRSSGEFPPSAVLQSTDDSLRRENEELKRRVQEKEAENRKLQQEVDDTRNRIGGLKSEGEKQRGEIDRLKSEGEKQRGEIDRLKSEGEKQRGEIDRLKSEGEKQRDEIDRLKSEGEKQRDEIDRLGSGLRDAESKNLDLERDRSRIQQDIEQIRFQKNEIERQKRDIEARLTRAEEEKNALLRSLGAESYSVAIDQIASYRFQDEISRHPWYQSVRHLRDTAALIRDRIYALGADISGDDTLSLVSGTVAGVRDLVGSQEFQSLIDGNDDISALPNGREELLQRYVIDTRMIEVVSFLSRIYAYSTARRGDFDFGALMRDHGVPVDDLQGLYGLVAVTLHFRVRIRLTPPKLFWDRYDPENHETADFPSPLQASTSIPGLRECVQALETNTIFDFFSVGYTFEDNQAKTKTTVWRRG
jgi:hypothetical protein